MSDERDNLHGSAALAPGKVILFGEHAVNRGQPAIAASVGLYARCRASFSTTGRFCFRSRGREERVYWADVRGVWEEVNRSRAAERLEHVRALTARDFFAPQKYILGTMFEGEQPRPLTLAFHSLVPAHSGLGSGGSVFVAMVTAVLDLFGRAAPPEERAMLAHLGDVVAHGGIASGLDTQTSLLGGVIRYTGKRLADRLPHAAGLSLVIGNTGVNAATGEVNARVRRWLDERPAGRLHTFRAVGALSRAAAGLLERGEWDEVGQLMNLNQLVLEKIGVSCPEADRLIAAALEAGAFGAKVSGSGGGGIIVALVSEKTRQTVADAITAAGGTALVPDVAVQGATVMREDGPPPKDL
jgi:mevalonate kinase